MLIYLTNMETSSYEYGPKPSNMKLEKRSFSEIENYIGSVFGHVEWALENATWK